MFFSPILRIISFYSNKARVYQIFISRFSYLFPSQIEWIRASTFSFYIFSLPFFSFYSKRGEIYQISFFICFVSCTYSHHKINGCVLQSFILILFLCNSFLFTARERKYIRSFCFFFFFCFVSRTYSHHKMNGYMLLSFILIFLCNSFLFTARDRRYIRFLFCFDFRTYSHHRINGYALLFFFFILAMSLYLLPSENEVIYFFLPSQNEIIYVSLSSSCKQLRHILSLFLFCVLNTITNWSHTLFFLLFSTVTW